MNRPAGLTDLAPVLVLERHPGTGAVRSHGPAAHFEGYRLPGLWDGIPEGIWSEWSWDGAELVARNDRLGFSPLFWFATSERAGVSPSLAALLPHVPSRELDDDALAVFYRFRSFIGSDTPFRHIRALPPGATLRWSGGRHAVTALGPRLFSPGPGTKERVLQVYGEVLGQAVRRAVESRPGRWALPLSAGLDSRMLLYAALAEGLRPEVAVTLEHLPPRVHDDVTLAGELAREEGLAHRVLEQPRDRLAQHLRSLRLTHLCTLDHAWYMPMADFFRAEGLGSYLDGIGGDIQADLYVRNLELGRLLADGRLEEVARAVLEDDYLPRMLAPPMLRRWSLERAVAHLARHLEPFREDGNPWNRFRFYNRTRRNVALSPFSQHRGGAQGLAPFLDREVVELLGPIPGPELAVRDLRPRAVALIHPRQPPRQRGHAHPGRVRRWPAVRSYGRSIARWGGGQLVRSDFLKPGYYPARLARVHVDRRYVPEFPGVCERVMHLLVLERWAVGLEGAPAG